MIQAILAVGLALSSTPPRSAADDPVGKSPPELKATKWYNVAPLTLGDLKGKAVLLQVFRTW